MIPKLMRQSHEKYVHNCWCQNGWHQRCKKNKSISRVLWTIMQRQTNEWQKQSRQQRITERPYDGTAVYQHTLWIHAWWCEKSWNDMLTAGGWYPSWAQSKAAPAVKYPQRSPFERAEVGWLGVIQLGSRLSVLSILGKNSFAPFELCEQGEKSRCERGDWTGEEIGRWDAYGWFWLGPSE